MTLVWKRDELDPFRVFAPEEISCRNRIFKHQSSAVTQHGALLTVVFSFFALLCLPAKAGFSEFVILI